MPTAETATLKPCPFCGSKDTAPRTLKNNHYVWCRNCGSEGEFTSTSTEAITAWNTRPIEDVLVKALEDAISHCGSCGGSGIAYIMEDETEIGQAPGSSGFDCPECSIGRAAIKAAKEEE